MNRLLAGLPASRQNKLQCLAGHTAKPMFWLSVIFLVCVASLVVLWVDVPKLHEKSFAENPTALAEVASSSQQSLEMFFVCIILLIWPIVALESLMHMCTRPWTAKLRKCHWFSFLCCVCPPLRMCARLPEMGDRLWLPGLGWRRADKRLRRKLERTFSLPMIIIALMILPILIVEFFLKAQVAQYAWLRFVLHIGTGVIWFAFAAEFILMFSVADKKLAYCKKHWIDLAIILLPLFSFLRSLRAIRATSAARLVQIPQMGKMARVYRLRGTALKGLQALLLLEAVQRFANRNPEKAIDKLERKLDDLEAEAKTVRRKIAKIKRAKQQQVRRQDPTHDKVPSLKIDDTAVQESVEETSDV